MKKINHIIAGLLCCAALGRAQFASYTNSSSGALGSNGFSITTPSAACTGPSLTAPYPFNLTDTANFDPPGSSTQASLIYDICANPTVTFTTAQNNLDLYLIYFRNASIAGVATYTLTPAAGSSGSWAIQSGLSGASVAGNTLTASTSGYNNGIVRFTGTLTGFTVTAVGISSTEYSSQAFTMAVPPAGPTCDVTNAATYSQGRWGNTSKGTALTSNFFQTKFSNGLSAGNGSRLVNFASASAVQAFLPNGGTPDKLPVGPTSNPTSKTIKNTLAGQAVAATLNLALSPGLAPATVQSGVFAGYTAQQLLDAANAALGGAAITKTGLSDLTLNLGYLNASFENRISTGFLACSDQ